MSRVRVQAGKLRHRVILKRNVETRDAHGGVVRDPLPVAKLWASVEPLRGRELFEAQQVKSEVSHRIRIRHYPGLLPSDVITHADRTYNIEHVLNPGERGAIMELLVKERPDG